MDGHGITTIREPGGSLSHELKLELKNKSEKNTIVAPRIIAFSTFNSRVQSPDEAKEWVREMQKKVLMVLNFSVHHLKLCKLLLKKTKG